MSDTQIGKLDIVLNATADKVTAEVDKVNAKLDQLTTKAQATSQRMIASNKGTVDSITGVAVGIQRNVSAIDNLGSKTDALLGKQHTAWTAIGAVAGGTTQTIITKITGLIDKANAIPGAIEAGIKPLIQSQYMAVDSLQLSNAELEKQTAILEKVPVNNAAIAIAEERVEVDKLAGSLDEVNTKMDRVLSQNHISAWERLLGKGSTSNVEGTIDAFNQQISDLAYQEQSDLRAGNTAAAAQDDVDLRAKLAAAHKKYQEMLAGSKDGRYLDNSANRADLQSADTVVMNEQDEDSAQDQNKIDKAANAKAEARARALETEKAAAEAEKAQKQKEYQEQMASFEQQYAAWQQGGTKIVGQVTLFWERMRAKTEQGSLAYLELNKRVGEASQREAKERADQVERDSEEAFKAIEEGNRAIREMQLDQRKARNENYQSTLDVGAIQARNAARLAELTTEEAGGRTMTRIAEATKLAALHAEEYTDALDALLAKQKQIASDPDLNGKEAEREKQIADLRKQIADLQGARAVQAQQDAFNIRQPSSSAVVGAKDALAELADAARDSAKAMHDLVDNTLNEVNKRHRG